VSVTFRKDGRLYTLTLRDKVVVEDPYLVLVKATAYAVKGGEPYMGRIVPRSVKDFLLKDHVVI
jgi:protein involved in ribonucleotide reduction